MTFWIMVTAGYAWDRFVGRNSNQKRGGIGDGNRWVWENHPDQPWEGPHACSCGAAGAPCPDRNDASPPKMPPGFQVDNRSD